VKVTFLLPAGEVIISYRDAPANDLAEYPANQEAGYQYPAGHKVTFLLPAGEVVISYRDAPANDLAEYPANQEAGYQYPAGYSVKPDTGYLTSFFLSDI
jgi:uncharacterized lipoprotein YbaY